MTAAVVIPVYKAELSYYEKLSLTQCTKVLSDFPVILLAPAHLSLDCYFQIFSEKTLKVERFENRYFADIFGYNQLMLSAHFYKRFLKYKFILIYQLDAYVFKNELLYWCNKNYDFIGAPHPPFQNLPGEYQFLKNYSLAWQYVNKLTRFNHQISNVGNGGFSLRKTRSFYFLLIFLKSKVKQWGGHNEDLFFKYWGNIFYPLFKLPPDNVALKFSIESTPKEALDNLNGILPFGCHAFEKHDWEALKPFISP